MTNYKLYLVFLGTGLVFILLLANIFILGTKYGLNLYAPPIRGSDMIIKYDNLSRDEILIIKELLNDISKDYLSYAKKITFTKNSSSICIKDCEIYCKGYGCGGSNDNGNIFINMNYNYDIIRKNICHELLHDIIFVKSNDYNIDINHRIIEDLGRKDVCYEK